jgi:hypothetical protein
VQPAEGRRKRLLLADMDSTMIRQECIDELAAEAGVGAHVAAITARAMNGELDFEGALRERVALLRGLPEGVIDRVFWPAHHLHAGRARTGGHDAGAMARMRRWCRAASPPSPGRVAAACWGSTNTAPMTWGLPAAG